MKPTLLWLALASVLTACGTTPPPRANSALVVRAEVAGSLPMRGDYGPGALGSASVAFATGTLCCSVGSYMLGLGHFGDKAQTERIATVLSAGLEVSTYVHRRVGLMLRAGPAGSPPEVPFLGRRGVLGGGAVFYRISDPTPPEVGDFAPLIELGIGANMFALNDERSSAGPEPVASSNAVSAFDLLVTLRIGANYGLELK
jgi:hypothetical protein